MRHRSLISILACAFVGCGSEPEASVSLQPFIDVSGVGRFRLDQYDDWHSYVYENDASSDVPFDVRIYPDRDELTSRYAARIASAVALVNGRGRELVSAGMPKVLAMMREYSMDLPEDVTALARQLVIRQLKIPEGDEIEMQFENRGLFRGLDIYAMLDDQGEFSGVFFDG